MRRALISSLAFAALFIGAADAKTYNIKSGPTAEADAAGAAAAAREGDSLHFENGRYAFTHPLTLNANNVDIRGEGPNKSVLSFTTMMGEGDALHVQGNGIQIRDLTIEDAKGAAIVAGGSNILIQSVGVHKAMGPGILVLNANSVIVRQSAVDGAMAGVAVQNSSHVDVLQNSISSNGTGIVVVDRPDGPQGGPVRVISNRIFNNSTQGVGIDVIAVKDVGIFENEIGEHGTANILIRAFGEDGANANFIALPRNVTIEKNKFGRAGFAPAQDWAPAAANGAVFADIVWDGARSYVSGGKPTTAPVLFAIENNSTTTGATPRFLSLGLEVAGSPASEASPSAQWPLVARFPAPEKADLK